MFVSFRGSNRLFFMPVVAPKDGIKHERPVLHLLMKVNPGGSGRIECMYLFLEVKPGSC